MHYQQNGAGPYRAGPSDLWWRALSSSMTDGHQAPMRSSYQIPRAQFFLQDCESGNSASQIHRGSSHVLPPNEGRWNRITSKSTRRNRKESMKGGGECIPRSCQQASWIQGVDGGLPRSTVDYSAFNQGDFKPGALMGKRRFGARAPINAATNGCWRSQNFDLRAGPEDWYPQGNSRSSSDKSEKKAGARGDDAAGRHLREWTSAEGLKQWNWSPEKFSFGSGQAAVVIERDAEAGVWKVSPTFGSRFSRNWLEVLSEWVSSFRKAKIEHNEKKLKKPDAMPRSTVVDHSSSDASGMSTNSNSESQNLAAPSVSCSSPKSPESTTPRPGSSSLRCGTRLPQSYLEICLSSPGASPPRKPPANPKLSIVNDQFSCKDHDFQGSNKNGEPTCKPDAFGSLQHPALKEAGKCPPKASGLGRRLVDSDLISISIRCEKMGITDMEAEMLAAWLQEHKESVNCAKLWLFDNKLTDLGAKSVTNMMHDGLMELHLSHNTMTNAGAELVISSISTNRPTGKPLWLRMEWNMLVVDSLMMFLKQQGEERGLIIDIPKFKLRRVKGRMSSQLLHEKNDAHVQIPWIRSQRLKPSEAPVLMAAKSSWTTPIILEPDIPLKTQENATHSGPLLIFPDTSALLGLIGISRKGQRSAAFTFEWLQSLCLNSVFGKSLPANQRVYFVLCDSVAKQLDGLKKQNPYVGHSIRKLMSSGLDQYGPAGDDFVTVLGAHEGEGMVVDRNAEVLDSRSHNVHDKGQATDLKIIEVALFFQQELCKRTFGGDQSSTGKQEMFPDAHSADRFPVVLLSNDNVQLVAAKSHGLPAFRFTDFSKIRNLRTTYNQDRPLTASAMRLMMEGWATRGLGESAKKSLQGEFDGAVACIKHLLESYEGVQGRFDKVRELLKSDCSTGPVLQQLRSAMGMAAAETPKINIPHSNGSQVNSSKSSTSQTASGSSPTDPSAAGTSDPGGNEKSSCWVSSALESECSDSESTVAYARELSQGGASAGDAASEEDSGSGDTDEYDTLETELVSLVRVKLSEWEGLVKSYQNPSRVLRWISADMK